MNIIEFNGKIPDIHDSVKIFQNVNIIGDVKIGRDSSIWFGCIIRGDLNKIIIGERANIQDLVIIHTYQPNNNISPNGLEVNIGNDVTIGHRVTIHSSKIGNRCLIGMCSIILDNVEIGDDCFVSAGSLLPKNKKYPPRSLISGNPAKIVRPLRDEEITNIKKEGKLYINIKNKY